MADYARAHATISGKVQGVFFRMETRETAKKFEVSGWVRNKRDGTVEAVFEGDKTAVNSMIEWCKQGPPGSRVDDVSIDWQPYTGEFSEFSIRY